MDVSLVRHKSWETRWRGKSVSVKEGHFFFSLALKFGGNFLFFHWAEHWRQLSYSECLSTNLGTGPDWACDSATLFARITTICGLVPTYTFVYRLLAQWLAGTTLPIILASNFDVCIVESMCQVAFLPCTRNIVLVVTMQSMSFGIDRIVNIGNRIVFMPFTIDS